MIKYALHLSVLILLFVLRCVSQQGRIVIESEAPDKYTKDSAVLYTVSGNLLDFDDLEKSFKANIVNNYVRFQIESSKLIRLQNLPFSVSEYIPYIAQPGDAIKITRYGDSLLFSGKGSKGFELVYQLNLARKQVIRFQRIKYNQVNTIVEYENYARVINSIYLNQLRILELYRGKVLPFIYKYFKGLCLEHARYSMTTAFSNLLNVKDTLNYSVNNLNSIYDSSFDYIRRNNDDDNDTISMGSRFGLRLMLSIELLRNR